MANKPARNYCFTIFEPFPTLPYKFDETTVKYACYQIERSPETQKLHIQGYLELSKPSRMGPVKEILKNSKAHLEPRKGTREQARDYCRKEESRVDGPWEWGDFGKTRQGGRCDLDAVHEALKEGKTEVDIADQFFATWTRNWKSFERYRLLTAQNRTTKTKGMFVYGKPGTGKTTWVLENYPDAYYHSSTMGNWYDGYTGQECCVFDDCYGSVPFSTYLKAIDQGPFRVPIKGSSIAFTAKLVIVIANTLPETWYKNERGQMDFRALYRRFEEIKYFDEDREMQPFADWDEFLRALPSVFTEPVLEPVV